ncbi:CPBP family intramembrane glutamic endopeptidase [Roseisolibacter sp. H3M3-2]|uniref:CPBP family intramembrane glutamic endopeptidase n=1 Tax=Roseisolibacter sp. H3M3-2 TaxID=3031323 RepID=UPI0023D9D664|nr:CPBP family intramembrane glutamic endopeptidase [Roseisolibacter sp. H3M3-2]MDF1502565.1 CPBP family intramembrane metalloprotease [Roseisolibacter sp. H3M3-2]
MVDGRPGAVWRLVGYGLALVVGTTLATMVLSGVAGAVYAGTGTRLIVHAWAGLAGAALAHLAMLRWIERRGWGFVALAAAAARPRPIAAGALLDALALGLPSAALLPVGALGAERAPDGSWWGTALSQLALLAPAALYEELLVRGYPFQVLREAGGAWPALLLTSAVFGVLHWQNPGATVGSVAIVSLAGVFLGAVLLATGSLWAAFAAHLAWNWTLAGALHAAVSGLPFAAPDYRVVDAGPDWLTGGAWGPEGGAAAAGGMLLAMGWLWRRGGRAARTTDDALHSLDARPDGRGSF